jgi:HlyD family secretion protein
MNARQRSFVALASVLLVISAVAIAAFVNRSPNVRVATAQATTGPVARQIFATGVLEPVKMVNTGSQISGTIQAIDADFNAPVRAGQIIARLDPSRYRAELVEAQAQVAQARAEHARLVAILDDARTKRRRAEQLRADDLVTAADLDAARTTEMQAAADVKAALANISAARAAVAQAQVNLNHTIIRSPIDGVVVNRNVDVGQTIAASVQAPVLFTIADLRQMQVLAEINEADVGSVRAGTQVTFQIESLGDQWFDGKVTEVRLQPVAEQAVASTAGNSPAPTPAATSGSSGATSGSTTQQTPTSQTSPTSSPPASTNQPTAATTTPSTNPTTAAPSSAGSGVINYVAIIDVDNREGRLAPGATAIVTVDGAQRTNVLRVPNAALTFRPSSAVLQAIGQDLPALEPTNRSDEKRSGQRRGYVWKFEKARFVPVLIQLGLADDNWTEVLGGALQPGDTLVTSALPGRTN